MFSLVNSLAKVRKVDESLRDSNQGRLSRRGVRIVGWRRVIETHQNVAQVVGLDDSTAPYDWQTSQPCDSNGDK